MYAIVPHASQPETPSEADSKEGNDTTRIDLPSGNSQWQKIELKDVEIKGGQCEVGFYADGKADTWCRIDEVSLVRTGDIEESTGIHAMPTEPTTSHADNRLYYNLSGTPSSQPYPGLNIVRETIKGKSRSYKIVCP
jgi:hypothetical protein